MDGDWLVQAKASYESGDVQGAADAAGRGLVEHPDDLGLLRMAAFTATELEVPDAERHLERLVRLAPDDVDAWRHLGAVRAGDGRLAEAVEAYRRVVDLDPGDVDAMADLAHATFVTGRPAEAVALLADVVDRDPDNVTSVANLRSLVDMLRATGQTQEALDRMRQLADRQPDDVLTLLDIADLDMAADRWDDALDAYRRLRTVEEEGHEIFGWHGMVEVEIRRGRWRPALDLVIEATRLDRHQLTTELLAFVAARLFGEGDRPGPSWDDLQAMLETERDDHRRLHAEALIS